MIYRPVGNKVQFDKGDYYIGDLSLVVDVDTWDKLCNGMDGKLYDGKFSYKGDKFWGANTYSEVVGNYLDNYGNEYSILTGIVGIIPAEWINETVMNDSYKTGYKVGHIIHFSDDFEVSYNDDGVMTFDCITIDTSKPYSKSIRNIGNKQKGA